MVTLPSGVALADGRGDSIALGADPRLEEVGGWYLLSPGTLAELYRERVTEDASRTP